MATVKLQAGAEFDIMSSEEHKKHLHRVKEDFLDHMRQVEGETVTHSAGPFTLTSAGSTSNQDGGAAGIYRVPVGFNAILTRCSVDYEGSNAASTVSCDVRVVADANTPAALRSIASVLPNVFAEGKSHAPLFKGGQIIKVAITGGPASTQIYCTVQVLLTQRRHLRSDILLDQQ